MDDKPLGSIDAAALAGQEPQPLYKSDGRSRVFRVPRPAGDVVVKQFQYAPWRQLLAYLLGMHPGQREVRRAQQLRELEIATAPILAMGLTRCGLGVKLALVSPWLGVSVQNLLQEGGLAGVRRRRLAEQVGALAGRLLAQGIYFRDLKTSNILVSPGGEVRLIDVGSARKGGCGCARTPSDGPEDVMDRKSLAMLGMLDFTARRDGASRTERLRALKAALACGACGAGGRGDPGGRGGKLAAWARLVPQAVLQ